MGLIVDHALAWAARGFRVFPILPGQKVPPKGEAGVTRATTDPETIRSWWAFEPNYNYGVAGGDGLLIVDVDAHKNGYASLMELDLPDTLAVQTPGGGLHLYFHGPDVQNTVDRVAPGIDIRSRNGYVVGPGSFFADPGGKKGYTGHYTVVDQSPVATPDAGFILRCGEPKERDNRSAVSVDNPDDIVFAIHYLQKDAPIAIEGRGGNNTAYAVAARLAEIGVSQVVSVDLMMEHWNERCLPPWSGDELIVITQNAENYLQGRKGSAGVTAAAAGFDDAVVLPPAAPVSAAGKFDGVFANRTITPAHLIPPRDWLVHRLMLRSEAAILAGHGGVGKSAFALALAAHGAMGLPFAGYHIPKRFKTVVYNKEDTLHDMESRMLAVCATYGFDVAEIQQYVLLWTGRRHSKDPRPAFRLRLIDRDHKFMVDEVKELARLVGGHAFDAMIMDPLNSLHSEEENDNSAMGDVIDALNGLAQMADIGVLVLHHTPKGAKDATSQDAIRGAGNIVNSVRMAATIFPADTSDATVYGFGERSHNYVKVTDVKANNSEISGRPTWFEKQSFPLENGDSTVALRPIDATVTFAGEAKLIAGLLATYMQNAGTLHLTTHDAAKVLVDAEPYFRERLPASGDVRSVKSLLELRLASPVTLDDATVVSVHTKTEPGGAKVARFVTLE